MNPWDRQPLETDESFLWFRAFLEARPPRQLGRIRTAAPGKVAPPTMQLLEWYNTYLWADRVAAWDSHLAQARDAEVVAITGQDARERRARDLTLINDANELASRELQKCLTTSLQTETETMSVGALTRLLDTSIKLGRLLQGESTENISIQEEYDLSKLTVDELRTLQTLQEKANARRVP